MATVSIFEIKTGVLVGQYPVSLKGLNYTPSQSEYFDQAWLSAVEDDAVNARERDGYKFAISE